MENDFFQNNSFCANYSENEERLPIANKLNKSDLNLTENSCNYGEATNSFNNCINSSKLTIDDYSDIDTPEIKIFNEKFLNLETEVDIESKVIFTKESLGKKTPKASSKTKKILSELRNNFKPNYISNKAFANEKDLNNKMNKFAEKSKSPLKDLKLINNKILNKNNFLTDSGPLRGNSKKPFLELSRNFLEKKQTLKSNRNFTTNKNLNFNGLNISKEFDVKAKMKFQSKLKLEPRIKTSMDLKAKGKNEHFGSNVKTKLCDNKTAKIKEELPLKRSNKRNSIDLGVLKNNGISNVNKINDCVYLSNNRSNIKPNKNAETNLKDINDLRKNYSTNKDSNFLKISSKNMFSNVQAKINVPKPNKISTSAEEARIIKNEPKIKADKSPFKINDKTQSGLISAKKPVTPNKNPSGVQNQKPKIESNKSYSTAVKTNPLSKKETTPIAISNPIKKAYNSELLLNKGSKPIFRTIKNTLNSPEIKNVKRKINFEDKCTKINRDRSTDNKQAANADKFCLEENQGNNYNNDQDLINSTVFFNELKNNFFQFEEKFNAETDNIRVNDLDNKGVYLKEILSSFDKQNKFYKEFFSLITVYYNIIIERKNNSSFNKSNAKNKINNANKAQKVMESGEFSVTKDKKELERELELLEEEYFELQEEYENKLSHTINDKEEVNDRDIMDEKDIYTLSELDFLRKELQDLTNNKNLNVELAKTNLERIRDNEKKIFELNECLIKLQEQELEILNRDFIKTKQHESDLSNKRSTIKLLYPKYLRADYKLSKIESDSNINYKCASLYEPFCILETSKVKRSKSFLNKIKNKIPVDFSFISYNNQYENEKSFSFRTGNISEISFQNNHENNNFNNDNDECLENNEEVNFNFSFDENKHLFDNCTDLSFNTGKKMIRNSSSKSLGKLSDSNRKNFMMEEILNFFKEDRSQRKLYNSCDKNSLNEKGKGKLNYGASGNEINSIQVDEGNKTLIFNFHLNFNNVNNNYFVNEDKKQNRDNVDNNNNFNVNSKKFKISLNKDESLGDIEIIDDPEVKSKNENQIQAKLNLNIKELGGSKTNGILNCISEEKDEILDFYKLLNKNISTGNLNSFLKLKQFNELSRKNLLKSSNDSNLNVRSYGNIGFKDKIKHEIKKMHAVDSIKNFLNNRSPEQSFNEYVFDYFDGIYNIEQNEENLENDFYK